MPLIVECKPEHTPQLVYTARSQLLIKMDNHLRIRVRVEAVAPALELRTKFGKVVNLAVKDHPNRSIFVKHRLLAARQINNAQPPHA